MFMMRMIGRKETVMNFHRSMIELENAFLKKVRDPNGKVWWETFLFYLSFFIFLGVSHNYIYQNISFDGLI